MVFNQQVAMLGAAGVTSLVVVGVLVSSIQKTPAPATPAAPPLAVSAPALPATALPATPATAPPTSVAPAIVAALPPGVAPAATPPLPGVGVPTFDVVRVERSGDTVVAGAAPPGSIVRLQAGGKVLAEAKVEASGQFVLIPPPLPAGDHLLVLEARTPDGPAVLSTQNVAVSVPQGAKGEVIVALSEPDKATVLLSDAPPGAKAAAAPPTQAQTPSTTAATAPAAAAQPLAIRTVEVEETGAFFATGRAPPGAALRLYLNDAFVADVTSGPDGHWSLKVEKGMRPGPYAVRTDAIDRQSGAVSARVEVPFTYPEKAAAKVPPAPPAGVATPPASVAMPPVGQRTATAQAGIGAQVGVTAPAGAAVNVPQPPASLAANDAAAAATVKLAPPAPPLTPNLEQPGAAVKLAPPAPSPAPVSAPPTATIKPAPPAKVASAAPADAVVEELTTATVNQGDSLWRISRIVYGRGIRYTQIYKANSDQIRNPELIFPGQILVMPKAAASGG